MDHETSNEDIMAPIVLYGIEASPPVRAVMVTAKALGLDLELKIVDLSAGEHMTEEYLKKNPMHTVPVLDDNGFILIDSHAIAGYLVQQYSDDKSLYPTDPKKRALVDSMLHFDTGIMFGRLRAAFFPVFTGKRSSLAEEAVADIVEAFGYLESLLSPGPWMTGDNLTIADLCTGASVTSLVQFIPAPVDKFPKLNAWLDKLTALPSYEANVKGIQEFKTLFEAAIKSDNSK